jgi:hypothetical protein
MSYATGVRNRLLLSLLAAVACGRELGAEPMVAQSSTDAGGSESPDAEAEPKIDTFPCGSTQCIFGQHACCLSGGSASCAEIDAGCAVEGDAGTDAATATGPQLLCGTYNNCDGGDDCCFRPDAGSKCASSCESGERNLCRIGQDGCGEGECVDFTDSPAPGTTGRCKSD